MRIGSTRRRTYGLPLALVTALALAGCKPAAQGSSQQAMLAAPALPATLPLVTGTASTPAYAPRADRLPAAPRLALSRAADPRQAYGWADNAADFGDAVFDAPPDYGFDYQGVEPWAWEGYDRSRVFVEPIDDGYRYYYYRPGADEPYFVRDPDYGYGYDDGRLAVIYAAGGAIVPYADYGPRADYAARYWNRGQALYEASQARERRAVIAANWAARSAAISAAQARWADQRAQQADWRAYHQRNEGRADDYWRQERERRAADATRFADWRRDDFRSAAPPRVIPANWQQAKWARDDRRYVVPAAIQAGPNRDAVPGREQVAAERDTARQRQQAAAQQQRFAQPGPGGPNPGPRTGAPQDHRIEAQSAAEEQRQAMRQQRGAQVEQARMTRDQPQAGHGPDRAQQQATRDSARGRERAQQQAARQGAQGHASEQVQAARRQDQSARQVAEGQAKQQAQAARQAAQGQAREQAQAVRQQEQAARQAAQGQAREQAHAARTQAQSARPAPTRPQPQRGGPPAGGGQPGGERGGGEHGGHGGGGPERPHG